MTYFKIQETEESRLCKSAMQVFFNITDMPTDVYRRGTRHTNWVSNPDMFIIIPGYCSIETMKIKAVKFLRSKIFNECGVLLKGSETAFLECTKEQLEQIVLIFKMRGY
jgi:hypothetical protein